MLLQKKNNKMCAITFLKACTLSRISSARVTFYIQNCFYGALLEKNKFSRVPNLKKLCLEILKYHIEKKRVDYFRIKKAEKNILSKKNFDCKFPMKWPIYAISRIFPNFWRPARTQTQKQVVDMTIEPINRTCCVLSTQGKVSLLKCKRSLVFQAL